MREHQDEKVGAQPGEVRERVLRVAAEMFAERGFHGASIRAIAAACNVGVATVVYYGGTKQQLLERILSAAFSAQDPLVSIAAQLDAQAIGGIDDFFRIYDEFVAVLVGHAVEFPQVRRLWLRLLLDEPALFDKLDRQHSWPLVEGVMTFLRAVRDRGVLTQSDEQLRYFIASIDWILDGFFTGGIADGTGARFNSCDAAELARLVDFLRDYGRRYLGPPGDADGASHG